MQRSLAVRFLPLPFRFSGTLFPSLCHFQQHILPDRTRLHTNSLLTGNFTGNFAILRVFEPMSEQETAVQQPLLKQFPTQVNRENILRIRELFRKNREFSRRFDVRSRLARL